MSDHDPDLGEAVLENARRYVQLFGDAVHDLLPEFKQREVTKLKILIFSHWYITRPDFDR